jgi:2-haloalkanoic acid dehalogenase type II
VKRSPPRTRPRAIHSARVSTPRPVLLTFDIFGTVLDWRTGLLRDAPSLRAEDFDRVVDRQAALEQEEPTRPYAEIVARSLVAECVEPERARAIGAAAGRWPLFADSREGLVRLRAIAPCMALTNSDRAHGEQVQEQLGFRLADWQCAEEVRAYKPSEAVWRLAAKRRGLSFARSWWHVSAYADYDLEVARRLGLTTVFVARPHSRPAPADVTVPDLVALAELLGA